MVSAINLKKTPKIIKSFVLKFIYISKILLLKIWKFICNVFNFWVKFARYDFLQIIDFRLPRKIWKKINTRRLKYFKNFLEKKYSKFIEEYKNKEIIIWRNDKKIWVLWWQWSENMPQLVKKCIRSIEENRWDYEVVVLDSKNYEHYVELPHFIMKKVEEKKISITHLSDIIRMSLLKQYGWVWVDATMFINSDIFKTFDGVNLNSVYVKLEDSSLWLKWGLSRRWSVKWSIWLIWWKSNRLFSFVYDFLIQYWNDYNYIMDYFLTDMVISIAYDKFEDCRKDIDRISNVNNQVDKLWGLFNKRYNENVRNDIMNIPYSKLTRKEKFHEVDKSGYLTIYWKFMQNKLFLRKYTSINS